MLIENGSETDVSGARRDAHGAPPSPGRETESENSSVQRPSPFTAVALGVVLRASSRKEAIASVCALVPILNILLHTPIPFQCNKMYLILKYRCIFLHIDTQLRWTLQIKK